MVVLDQVVILLYGCVRPGCYITLWFVRPGCYITLWLCQAVILLYGLLGQAVILLYGVLGQAVILLYGCVRPGCYITLWFVRPGCYITLWFVRPGCYITLGFILITFFFLYEQDSRYSLRLFTSLLVENLDKCSCSRNWYSCTGEANGRISGSLLSFVELMLLESIV